MSRLQQQLQQQHALQQQQQSDLLRHVFHRDKFKMTSKQFPGHYHHHHHNSSPQPQKSSPRLDISAPILLASTLNPNDVDAHKAISAFSAQNILSHLEQINPQKRNQSLSPAMR